jgi:hypothetical protein
VGIAQLEPFVDQPLSLAPPAGVEGVLAEQEHRFDGRGDRAAFAAVLDGALEGLAALGEPVEVGDGDAGTDDAGRADLLAETGDRGVGAGQHVRGEAGRVAEGLREDGQELGRARPELTPQGTWESAMNAAWPADRSPANEAWNLPRSRNRKPFTGGRIGGCGPSAGNPATSVLTDSPLSGANAVMYASAATWSCWPASVMTAPP